MKLISMILSPGVNADLFSEAKVPEGRTHGRTHNTTITAANITAANRYSFFRLSQTSNLLTIMK